MKRADGQLQASEWRLGLLMEAIRDFAIFMLDADGCVMTWNSGAEAVKGYTSAEILGQHFSVFYPPEARDLGRLQRQLQVAATEGRFEDEGWRVRKDGSRFWASIIITPVRDAAGELVGFAKVTRDQSERRAKEKLREERERARRMAFDTAVAEARSRRGFAMLLHDSIGQDLALTKIKLTSIREDLNGKPRTAVDESLTLLSHSIAETRSLISSLSPPMLYELGLRAALSWLSEEMRRAHGLQVMLADDDADKPLDDATAGIVFRAIRELLTNVVKHAGAMTAEISLARVGDQLDVVVSDAGAGFEPEDAPRDPTRSSFGLLSVHEQIVHLGGTMTITSAKATGTSAHMRVALKRVGPHDGAPEGPG